MNNTDLTAKAKEKLENAEAYLLKAEAAYESARNGDNMDELNDAFFEYNIAARAVTVLTAYHQAFESGKTLAEANLLAEEAIVAWND